MTFTGYYTNFPKKEIFYLTKNENCIAQDYTKFYKRKFIIDLYHNSGWRYYLARVTISDYSI
jgi:hypothetical protein